MAEISESAALGALEAAFGDAPPPKAKETPTAPSEPPVEAAEEAPEDVAAPVGEEDGEPVELEAEGEEEAPAEIEPEYEVEVGGRVELVRGKEQVKELLQKGLDYTRKTEINARHAEIIAAQAKALEVQQQAQNALYEDFAQLKALDAQLDHFNRIDMAAEFEKDPFQAMKLKEQRDQLREYRRNKADEIGQKHAVIQQGQAQAAQATLRAEEQALLAKLPQWRNSEQAAREKSALVQYLADNGFNQDEIAGIMDHRALLVTRKAWLYDQLQAQKAGKVKQLRDAPQMAKPGAAPAQQKTNQKASFAKFQQELRAQGKKGNSRAQENLMLGVLNRAFK
jgi:hypothetical protein